MVQATQGESRSEQVVIDWIEQHIGPVTRVAQQGRWRDAWYIDAMGKDGPVPLYVRGDRGGDIRTQPHKLSFEYDLQMLLEAGGMRVPHNYGYIESLPAIVMERVPGIPDLRQAGSDSDRVAVSSQFVDQMILMHEIDPHKVAAAGTELPVGAKDVTLSYYRRIEPLYRDTKRRPEPAIEFIRGWIERNVPVDSGRAYPIAVDAGQFLFDGDRLTAMLDFEFAALGDYHTDLATLRLRGRMEYVGDLGTIYRQYAERSGRPVDRYRLLFHTVVKGVLPPMHSSENMSRPTADIDYVQYAIWNTVWLRVALESIAELNGWAAEIFVPPEPLPPTRWATVTEALMLDAKAIAGTDAASAYQRRRGTRTVGVAQRAASYAAELERRYMADVAAVTGQVVDDWQQADAVLEAYVLRADPAEDERLVRMLWRQQLGICFLFADESDPANHHMLTTPLEPLDL